jgi:hypothetical protein
MSYFLIDFENNLSRFLVIKMAVAFHVFLSQFSIRVIFFETDQSYYFFGLLAN